MNDSDTISYFENKIDKLNTQLNIEREKVTSLQQEIVLLKQYSDYQNSKIDKVTSLIGDLLEKKSQDDAVLSSIQALQEDVDVGDIQGQMDQLSSHHGLNPHQQQQQQQMLHNQHRQAQRQQQQQQQAQQQRNVHIQQDLSGHMENNMDPALHQVAVATAAVQAQAQANQQQPPQTQQQAQLQGTSQLSSQSSQKPKKKQTKRKADEAGFSQTGSSSKPPVPKKIEIMFIHNPTTVKEIYDEFYSGYKGQEPLCGLDAKYGKHEWRGDSRSKESKRYQRRKKLCDAIQRGMLKYGKSADEVIEYLEDFRKEKSLTWLMNGNLPEDLDS
ncbi:High-osmolarity-induced transcription protein 1 [Candida viswanathii]|uniref:High-osmolarity-induced transcription protein 1 n=1 Tax=Candida viswanathii TaxID=5486 RepID=A0A367XN35_9ASCO|nr:High-osmolarity-induced transcription protein 1 [Candida viswanathii]